ncbi:hypothetical protein BKA70DRAFT_1199535 [Coprinopsis sp. MPI-PUGE-AT-0042]|nr:hypothetical protein BKA70DRAFT_1199535 [Coprinopsis sp. MPI-PUGE-AT-0042]
MTHLQYFLYTGFGEHKEKLRSNEAVRIRNRIECSGQAEGTLTLRLTSLLRPLPPKPIRRSRISISHLAPQEERVGWLRNFQEWVPDHQPLFNLFGVKESPLQGMGVESEVVPYLVDE